MCQWPYFLNPKSGYVVWPRQQNVWNNSSFPETQAKQSHCLSDTKLSVSQNSIVLSLTKFAKFTTNGQTWLSHTTLSSPFIAGLTRGLPIIPRPSISHLACHWPALPPISSTTPVRWASRPIQVHHQVWTEVTAGPNRTQKWRQHRTTATPNTEHTWRWGKAKNMKVANLANRRKLTALSWALPKAAWLNLTNFLPSRSC